MANFNTDLWMANIT